jgi:hypothetical protein
VALQSGLAGTGAEQLATAQLLIGLAHLQAGTDRNHLAIQCKKLCISICIHGLFAEFEVVF